MRRWAPLLLVTAFVLFGAVSSPAAPLEEVLMPLDRYTTAKAQALASQYRPQLVSFYENIYYCIPWVDLQKNGIGFRTPRWASADDRYLSVWIWIDQHDDAQFSAMPQERRASAMLSRYGVELLRRMKARVEEQLGFELASAATGYPPGVPQAEVRATANVLRAAGLECTGLVDEPTAANNVLQIRDGAIADVGGGTTGVAVFREGQVVYTADEPTGGVHFSLVIAGAKNITLEEAEAMKTDPRQQAALFPVIRPVMEKVGAIVRRHIAGHNVETLYLVGGTCAYPGMDAVVQEYTGVKTFVPGQPLFITPLGIAMHN